ncbi:MAG: DUF2075 domain-containing protein [Phycisphaeraceae bacterium]
MKRAAYSGTIAEFLEATEDDTLGKLVAESSFSVETTQRKAWQQQICVLKEVLLRYRGRGSVYFEWSIPRLGKRIDVVTVIDSAIFVIEFKVGESAFNSYDIDQVTDYALDLKNFHESSHDVHIVPVLIATEASLPSAVVSLSASSDDLLMQPVLSDVALLPEVVRAGLLFAQAPTVDVEQWEQGGYHPTPTIVEAATALFRGHSVEEIARSDAGAINLSQTTKAVAGRIKEARDNSQKIICFVTGVPGAGKTLVGLNVATQHMDPAADLYSVFLSGNGPLVRILREALALDSIKQAADHGEKLKKGEARSRVKAFVQNVHNFRDEGLLDPIKPPIEHVAIFDEAQRAWNQEQTTAFMRQKKGKPDFNQSEPAFLISCMDRHDSWAVIVCLVGGGQEINRGEAGIREWIESAHHHFPDWHLHLSSRLTEAEYQSGDPLRLIEGLHTTHYCDDLHLSVSMRSFRAEQVSMFVKQVLEIKPDEARRTLQRVRERYPIVLTRDLAKAKQWLRQKARGSERYGMVVSSNASRLKPYAIDVRPDVDPVHWFLHGKDDVRSSYQLEDVATEFLVQGLELDWACLAWDADLRMVDGEWEYWSFKGSRWQRTRKAERQTYLVNAYRVLLTRARQGMVIVVPDGNISDATRPPGFYDETYEYLRQIGLDIL